MHSTAIIQLLLAQLQAQFDRPLAYYPKEDMFVVVGQRDESGQVPLFPITGESGKILWLSSTEDLVFAPAKILSSLRSAGSSSVQDSTSARPGFDQATTREINNLRPEQSQASTSDETAFNQSQTSVRLNAKQRKIIEYYRLADFSQAQPKGYLRQLAKEIFLLTVKTLQTSNQRVIDEVLGLYDRALKLSDQPNHKDLNELRKIKSRLETIYNRQQSANHNRQAYQHRRSVWRKIQIVFALALLVLSIFAYIYFKIHDPRELFSDNDKQPPKITITATLLTNAIDQYEQTHSIRVWQWRRNKIRQQLIGRQLTRSEFEKTLDSLITKAWK